MIDVEEADAVAAELLGRLVTPEARDDPYSLYEEMRSKGPVLDSGVGFWLVTGHAEVRSMLHHPGLSSDESHGAYQQAAGPRAADAPLHPADDFDLMLFMDPPDHTRLRRLVARSFTPMRVRALRPHVVDVVDRLLRRTSAGEPFDVIADLAFPLATQVICELLGVPVSDRERFGAWSSAMARAVDPSAIRTPEDDGAIAVATANFLGYFEEFIDARRADPGNDLMSALIAAEDDGDCLSHDELISMGALLLIAGHETTVNLIGNAVGALLDRPAALERLRSNATLDATAVDEFVRFDAPVQMTQRVAVADVEIGQHVVPAGTSLILLLGAANRDPAVFAAPGELQVDRSPNEHLGFGGGIHHCLGAALARTEGEIAVTSLLRQSRRLELLEEPERRTTFTLRGFDRVLVQRG